MHAQSWDFILNENFRYWLSVGAQPSDPVQRILFKAGLLPPPPMTAMSRKGGSRDTRPINPITGKVILPPKSTQNVKEDDDESNDAGAGDGEVEALN